MEGEHLEPTGEIQLETVKSRAVRGVLALTGRSLVLNIIALIAQGFLWAFLSPAEFGTFWIVSAIVNFLVYFSDIGLAAALIQKKDKPSETDLKTTFTVQQGLVLLLLLILYFLTPVFEKTHGLTLEAKYLLYALGLSFFLSSLKSIPSVLLERKLEFGKFIIPQVLETFVYNIVVVYLAWQGLGIRAFTYAVVIRGLVGLITIYILAPWKPGLAFSKKSLKELLKFGVPYQINTLLAVVKDDGMTVILGGILGAAGMGILGTAQKLAAYPLRFFMDNVTKVTFPAFARMQHEEGELSRSLTRSIFFITFLVFPSIVGLVILAPILVKVIPRYEKWTPALVPLTFLALNTIFAGVTTQLTNLFNAIGKIKITFGLMVMWTVLTLVLVPFGAWRYGPVGAAGAYATVSISSLIAIFVARKLVDFSLWQGAGKTLIAALFMGLILLVVKNYLPLSLFSLLGLIVFGGGVYMGAIFLLYGAAVRLDLQKGIKAILGK